MTVPAEKLKRLLEVVSVEDRMRLEVLSDAVSKTLQDYQDNGYTTPKLKAWKAAEQELDDFADQLQADIEDRESGDLSFASIADVVRHLDRTGWKISQSTIYKHKKNGLLRPDERGRFLRSVVDVYAARNLQRLDGVTVGSGSTDEKQQAEIRKTVAQAEHWEIKTSVARGMYIPRDDHERDLATRAGVLKSDLLDFCRSRSPDIISLVDGDSEKVTVLSEYMIDQVLSFLDRYAKRKGTS